MSTVNELAKQSGAPAHVVRYYARVEQALAGWDEMPDGHCICHPIESFDTGEDNATPCDHHD